MKRICLLITKPPHDDESANRMCGISKLARQKEMEVAVYLLGDGVLCAKKNQKGFVGQNIKEALENGVDIKASENDLHARAIPHEQVESGITVLGDLEEAFLEDIMEKADRVISW